MEWARYVRVADTWCLSELLYHYPAGGKRSATEAARFKAMGVQDGVPDLMLPIASGPYSGAWWELKIGRNKPTPRQLEQQAKLRALGHYVRTSWHWTEAAADMLTYLEAGPYTVKVSARL